MHLLDIDLGPGVRAGFTRRTPGTSRGAYAEFDLAQHVGDDPAAVAANRAMLGHEFGAPVVFVRQVHGVAVHRVDRATADSMDVLQTDVAVEDGGDALVTTDAQVALGVLVADCVPVLLADADAGVIGTAHAGRVGLLGGVLDAVLDDMVHAGADLSRIRAGLGPAAGPCCYEVPEAMRADSAARLPSVYATTTWGTASLDLRAGCREVLTRRGVEVVTVGGCTLEDEEAFSYRRSATTGRFAGVVRLLA